MQGFLQDGNLRLALRWRRKCPVCLGQAGWGMPSVCPRRLRSADATAAALPNLADASSRTWRRPPTAWRKGRTSPRTGGASGPSGRRAPGPAGEASSPRSGTACGRGTAPGVGELRLAGGRLDPEGHCSVDKDR